MNRCRTRRTGAVLAAAVLVAAGVAGCAGDGSTEPPDSARTDPSPTGTGSASPTDPPAAPESAPGSSTVDPSRVMVEEDVTFTFPPGWTVTESNVSADISSATDGTTGSRVMLSDSPDSAAPTLDKAAETGLLNAGNDPAIKRLENVVLGGGAEAYQLHGKRGTMIEFWEFGTIHRGARVYLQFTLSKMLTAQVKRDLIDSVLASAQWR